MRDLLLPLGLVVAGVLLLASEVFIPSAGVLGVLAALCLLSGIITAFYYGGLEVGTAFMTVTVVGVGLLVGYMIRKWPETTFGKLILNEPPPEAELLPDRSELKSLVGRVGQALSLMLPSGLVEIDQKRYDATAETTVEEGTWVEVVSIRNGRNLVVRPISLEKALQARRRETREQDPLSAPVDEVLPDPFDDALG